MRFEILPVGETQGAILVHSRRVPDGVLKKGSVLTHDAIGRLVAAGVDKISVVKLEPGDVGEDEAARRLAEALAGSGVRVGPAFTGRANLYAQQAGVVVLDPAAVDAINLIDDALTVATLAPYAAVAPQDMIATVKVIPYAASESAVACAVSAAQRTPVGVAAFRPLKTALIATRLPGQKAKLFDKIRSALTARLAPLGGTLVHEKQCAHETAEVAQALKDAAITNADILFVLGASAIADRRDVVPAGIVAAGGKIVHFGMPVDPGNLLLLARMQEKWIIGLPGCARSPKLNGFDFVLQRLFAGLPVGRADIMGMGVGGLLKETSSRGQPRRTETPAQNGPPRIAAVILAAGMSSRMGRNKLLAEWHGKPLVRHVVEAALVSDARPVIVVTGHAASRTKEALSGLDVRFVHNPDYADGLSTSLKAGIGEVPEDCDGALVLLGDMPQIRPKHIAGIIGSFAPREGRPICVAVSHGKRGHPVLWGRRFFSYIASLSGDIGARKLLAAHEGEIHEMDFDDDAVLNDIDTPEALEALLRSMPDETGT